MTNRILLALSLMFATAALGQGVDPLRNVSGTAANPGNASPWVAARGGAWTFFHGLDAHVTYVSETGPEQQRNEVFSTNWLAAGVHREIGDRAFLLLRGRISLEPYTIPDGELGYPQLLQFISRDAGGPYRDRMRPHDLIGEAAVQIGFRPTEASLLHLYAAPAGDPALGAPPFALRSSGVDFAEAPFAYDIQESFHDATSVVTAGFATRWITIEGSVFHNAVTFGDHTDFEMGDIDSRSARVTLTPSPNVALQVSRGELGEDADQRQVTSGSISYVGDLVAVTALWTRREREIRAAETAFGFELALRGDRNTFLGRAEWVDRPLGFPRVLESAGAERTAHLTLGYIFDFLASRRYRAGIGANLDYHTQTHDIEDLYGHKPQSIYAFLRLRTAM